MRTTRTHVLLAVALLAFLLPAAAAEEEDLAPKLRAGLVRLHITSQSYDPASPWRLYDARTNTCRGVVIDEGVVLTLAPHVCDQRMIEISVANSARRHEAVLKHVDHRMGFALVEVTDPELRATLKPLPIGDPISLDDEVAVHQLGAENMLERYTARVVRATGGSTGLRLQVKTTCSDNGDGQVAIQDGKIVGLLTSVNRYRQEGTLASVESLRHYLDDAADEIHHGLPGPGPWTQQLLRADLRTYYGLGADQHGIALTRVIEGRTGDGVLKEGDVLLAVDGYDLDDEGRFLHESHGRLHSSYLLKGRRYAGDKVKVRILRDGEEQDVDLELRGQPEEAEQVPQGPQEGRPQFIVVGGLVLLELTSSSRISRSPGGVILRRHRERAFWDPPSERKRIVYVDRVLQDRSNRGFEYLQDAPLLSVNGKTILEIADVVTALETPENGFHVFRFEGLECDFVIPADELETIDKRIAETYKVTRLRYLENGGE